MGFDQDNDEEVIFFNKNNPVNIAVWFDPEEESFVASATLSSTGEKIFDSESEELDDAIVYITGLLKRMCEDPELFNDRLKAMVKNIGKEKPSKVSRIR